MNIITRAADMCTGVMGDKQITFLPFPEPVFFVLLVIKTGISNAREPNCFSNNTPLLCYVILL